MTLTLQIKGIVQGVGFRPHVWNLATSLGLTGFVRNDANGVWIEVAGENAERFAAELKANPPPLSKITEFSVEAVGLSVPPCNGFQIVESDEGMKKSVQISPDISICEDCKRELFEPSDRRHHYPFINCVNCGPRYSIIRNLPYDRPNTSMAEFELCEDCAREYADPTNRRYHAQPVACPVCGPRLWFEGTPGNWESVWKESIEAGKIIAVKGIGGFHLACDALNAGAVAELRRRKQRENKPFALMVPDLDWVNETCELSSAEEKLLTSRERPIVVLRVKKSFQGLDLSDRESAFGIPQKKRWEQASQKISPGFPTLGIMLPYTPMHHLMFDAVRRPLVMTSANYSSEPMIHTNEDALKKLAGFADEFLLHDREIVNRCDDSVCAVYGGQTIILRPGRGMAPVSFPISGKKCVLGMGADMKNTFAVAHNGWITLSPYIGDLENPETQEILKSSIQRYLDCYGLEPERIVHDLHPDYFSTQIAKSRWGQAQPAVQHHHAHCIATAVEHGIEGRAIGIAFDGTGYGSDGTIWGGEILEFDARSFDRKFHLRPFALPGGEKAVQEPTRTLVSILSNVDATSSSRSVQEWKRDEGVASTLRILEAGINCPMTSSMGRLFDAAAVLLGACEAPTFDGEGPMRLEAMADPDEQGTLPFKINGEEIDWRPMFAEMVNAQQPISNNQYPITPAALAARFHHTVAVMIFACIAKLPNNLPVLFSGGVFQNRLLVEGIKNHPAFDERRMFFSSYPNDSAIALGQAAWGLMSAE